MGYQTRKLMPLDERFNHYVRRSEGCWDWAGKFDGAGYANVSHMGTWLKASRVSWQIHRDDIAEGLHVLHKCDNPRCTNPEHLFLGTNLDNVMDKVSKSRQYRKYPRECSVAGCVEKSRKLGLCYRHYNHQYHQKKRVGA